MHIGDVTIFIMYTVFYMIVHYSSCLNSETTFLKAFQVNLKGCLVLLLCDQFYHIFVWGWFLGDIILWAMPTPYYDPLLWFMMSVQHSLWPCIFQSATEGEKKDRHHS